MRALRGRAIPAWSTPNFDWRALSASNASFAVAVALVRAVVPGIDTTGIGTGGEASRACRVTEATRISAMMLISTAVDLAAIGVGLSCAPPVA